MSSNDIVERDEDGAVQTTNVAAELKEGGERKGGAAAGSRAIDDLGLVQEEHQHPAGMNRKTKRIIIIGIVVAAIVIIATAIPLIVVANRKNKRLQPINYFEECKGTNSTNPTNCSSVPDNWRWRDMTSDIVGHQICPCEGEDKCCTPAEDALYWMIYNNTYEHKENAYNSDEIADTYMRVSCFVRR